MSSLLDWLVEHEPSFRKTRLPSLYSDLTVQRTTNPEGYAANVTAWTSALTRLTLAAQLPPEQHSFILNTSNDLLSALASPTYGQPSGLGSVLDECVRQGKMVDLKDFMADGRTSIFSKSWIPSPWAVLKWGLSQVGVGGPAKYDLAGGRLRSGNLVVVAALEERWKQLQQVRDKRPQGLTDRILSREAFVQEVNATTSEQQLSDQDIIVLLRYLSLDKQVLSYDADTIKFKAPNASTTQQPDPITQEDRHIASLKLLIKNLTTQVDTLNARITTLQTTARDAVKQHNKVTALSALRSKQLAERNLTSRSATLHQLEEVYTQIEAAVDHVQVVQAMEASAGVLKGLNKQVGSVDRVADVIDQLTAEMGKVDEVTGVLNEPLDAKAVLDEGELDDELEGLEREEVQKVQAEETRRRLAELETIEREKEKAKAIEMERSKENNMNSQLLLSNTDKPAQHENDDFEKDLSSSMERLKALDLYAQSQKEKPKSQQPQQQQAQKETDSKMVEA
ncbi:hypothetical protein LTR84_007113 [Exophiala bonariae]|uniref:SNF7 family protein n=1 Tax=Exophiala bonariae TaxID=1690606 RepID=A0AAV9N2Z7_9EURO|nr:hypothetical protein LTR84_007113 [Exophiala bonariae]